ncbi:UPF0481 protein At3g47200-like [Quercus suber]|uniref:UPF0481 protein At3g47200-like n=1 Tax=Quercus suber TaxID=58331 RepID=UPI0032DE399A
MEESGGKENENQIGTLVNEITVMIGNPERSKSSPECYINRVPDYLCKVNKEAYTPRIISIGPIHHSTLKLQPMEKYKERFLKSFIDRKEIKTDLENLVNTVWEMEEKISCCYAKTIALSKDDFVKMILMDAIFILELFLINYDIGDNHEESHKIAKSLIAEEEEEAEADEENWMASMVIRDLLLLENQLPFFVLETLYNIAFPDRSPSLIELTFECFKSFNIENMTPDNLRTKIKHFTHLLKTFQLNPPKKLPERKEGPPKLLYSATQLNEAGVKFRKSSRKSLLGIHFDSKRGVLEIPCLTLDDSTEILIRNIIALEQSQGKGYVTDYFAVLDFLIDTAKDIDLLCNEEIVVNYLGDSNAATSVVNKLNTDVIWYDTNSEYLRICEDLNDFYRIPWHRWKATLTHQYFSTPWKAASTIAAIILLVLTLIQSVISIIQVA